MEFNSGFKGLIEGGRIT